MANTDSQAALDALNVLDNLDPNIPNGEDATQADSMPPETLSDSQATLPRMSDKEFDGTMSELNRFIGSVYQDLSEIDPVFKKASSYCMERANEWAEAAEKSGKGINSDEGAVALAIASVGIAMNGLGTILKVWEKQKKIFEYKRICQSIVKTKGPHIDSMLSLAKRAVDGALEDVENNCNQQIDVASAFSNSYEDYKSVKSVLMSSINRYREAQFVFDQMVWLRDQIVAWSNGELEDYSSAYPSYKDINDTIFFGLHPYDEKAAEKNKTKAIYAACDNVVDEYIKMVDGAYQVVNSDYLISLCDNELMATLLHNCSEESKYKLLNRYATADAQNLRNALEGELTDSSALKTSYELEVEANSLTMQEKKHENLMYFNGLLILSMACLPVIFLTDWAWYWKTVVGVLIAAPILYRLAKAVNRIEEKTQIKVELIKRWEKNSILKMTGYKPPKKSIARMQNSVWATIIAVIIGGIVGSFCFPVIGTIIGACIGALVGGNDDGAEESDGSNWRYHETGSITKTKTWTVILGILLLAELYWLFLS